MARPMLSLVSTNETKPKGPTLSERRTSELVFAFVGPIGSGVSFASTILKDLLESEFAYEVSLYKTSKIISDCAHLIGENVRSDTKISARVNTLQDIGNKLRKKFDASYLGAKCVEEIGLQREHAKAYEKIGNRRVPLPRRHAHIIDSVKNPSEISLLKDVYGDVLVVFGIFAPEEVRKTRLKSLGHNEQDLSKIMDRDESEAVKFGQRVRDTIQMSDFFLRNDRENDTDLKSTMRRFLDVLFNIEVKTPTRDESAMYNAVSAASRSACLSRQVGAAIYTTTGELIGIGANDVPKAGGGLYSIENGDDDHRCFMSGGKICHNDDRKDKLYARIFEVLRDKGLLKDASGSNDVRTALFETDIRNLIEYSRSVHAEMEAIISVARGNKSGIRESTLYCTTFPCHSCARHIVASGIRKVVYIEPYPKSLALVLHKDSISTDGNEAKKVLFQQYEGVAPKNLIKFFKTGAERKRDGRLLTKSRKLANPIFQPPLDGFTVHELMVVNEVSMREKEVAANDSKKRKTSPKGKIGPGPSDGSRT